MSSNIDHEEHDPVANLNMQPARGILKSTKSMDDPSQDTPRDTNHSATAGMTRSESKSHKIPHFDEMNIIATYHPVDKDYGHMKIEEPKTPYAPNDIIDEEVVTDPTANATGIDPNALTQRLKESSVTSSSSSSSSPSRLRTDHVPRRSIDEGVPLSSEDLEHRKQFENHRKQHYKEFEVVRLHKKEIDEELRALEQEEANNKSEGKGNQIISSPHSSVKPILVHHDPKDLSSPSGHHYHHVHVEDNHDDDNDHSLTPEERERKKQFELKRKKHYDEFRAARMADNDDDEPATTG